MRLKLTFKNLKRLSIDQMESAFDWQRQKNVISNLTVQAVLSQAQWKDLFILVWCNIKSLMHYSVESKESKLRDPTRFKKDKRQPESKGLSKAGSQVKSSSRSTPKHSKDKISAHSNREAEKANQIKSDYYNSENLMKYPKVSSSNSNDAQMLENNKKSRRNMGNAFSQRQAIQFGPYCDQQMDQYQQKAMFHDSDSDSVKVKSPILKKIKQLSSEGSIDFNGEIVRNSRLVSLHKDSVTVQAQKMDYSGYDKCDKKKSAKSKKKMKSKSKSKQKIVKGSVSKKKKTVESSREYDRNTKVLDGKRNNEISEQRDYVISPYQNSFKPAGPVQIAQLQQEVQQDLENAFEFILSQELIKQRGQCLNMLGKICSSMNLKRETFSAALTYIDSFIDINSEIKSIKTITIAALMMALKIDHAEMVGTGLQMSTLSSMQSLTEKGLSFSTQAKSQQKKSKKKDSVHKNSSKGEILDSSKQPKFNLNRPKLPNVLTTVLSHEEIFSQYDRILCKEEIMDMQMQMMVKLNFKLTIRSFTFWADSLTILWDSYILQSFSKLKSKVCFRTPDCIKNLSYMLELVEVSYYFPYAYFYPKVILVLSVMYLLVRIRIEYPTEKEEKGFDHYRINLGKSTNIIFVDKMGTNELFGEFLAMLKLDMGDIVSCCQYVSHYFNSKILRVFAFESNRSISYEQHIGSYHYNPQIYRFFQVKIGGVLSSATSHDKADLFY